VAKLEAAVITQTGGAVQSFINNDILTQTSVEIPYGGNIFATSSIPAQQYVLGQTLGALPFLQSEAYVNLAGTETAAADRNDLFGVTTSSLINIDASPAFLAAKAGSDYLGPVSYAAGVPVVTFASPVKDNNGNIIGVITGVAALDELQNIIASSASRQERGRGARSVLGCRWRMGWRRKIKKKKGPLRLQRPCLANAP
jgi:hypothetical protein